MSRESNGGDAWTHSNLTGDAGERMSGENIQTVCGDREETDEAINIGDRVEEVEVSIAAWTQVVQPEPLS